MLGYSLDLETARDKSNEADDVQKVFAKTLKAKYPPEDETKDEMIKPVRNSTKQKKQIEKEKVEEKTE